VIFIAGFSVAIFTVATRVILGHSDRLDLVRRRRGSFITAFVLITLAMIARFSAEFVATRNEHFLWAGALLGRRRGRLGGGRVAVRRRRWGRMKRRLATLGCVSWAV
jgi:hypothetical protein